MKRSRIARTLLPGLLLAALVAPGSARAELWRWLDADGVAHFTPDPDRVPAASRSTLVRVEPGMAPAPAPAAAAKPPAIFAPPGDPSLAADPFNEPVRAEEIEVEVVTEPVEAAPRAGGVASEPIPAPPPKELLRAPVEPEPAAAELVRTPSEPEPTPPVSAPSPREAAPAPAELVRSPATILRDPGEIVVEVPTAPPPSPPAPLDAEPSPSLPPESALPAVASGASAGDPVAAPALAPELEARRAELVAAIARDEEALKDHVSSATEASVVTSPELRQIAERLPALQAELRTLDAQRAAP